MTGIFISHANEDQARAQAVRSWLIKEGYGDVFLSCNLDDGIRTGEEWENRLHAELRRRDGLVALISGSWLDSPWCFTEWSLFVDKPRFPVQVAAVDLSRLCNPRAESLFSGLKRYNLLAWHEQRDQHARKWVWKALQESTLVQSPAWSGKTRPFTGLEPLGEEHGPLLGGRDRETREAFAMLNGCRRSGRERVFVLAGDSGVGKSSVLRAKLLPLLSRDAAGWLPLPAMRAAAAAGTMVDSFGMAAERRKVSADAWRGIRLLLGKVREKLEGGDADGAAACLLQAADRLRTAAGRSEATLLFPIDQAEELLLGDARSEVFLQMLSNALADGCQPPRLIVALTLRADFLGQFAAHGTLQHLGRSVLNLPPLAGEALNDAVDRPLRALNIEADADLRAALLRDAVGPGVAPLLALVMSRLHDEVEIEQSRNPRANGRLTLKHYDGVGGLRGVLTKWADEIFDKGGFDAALIEEFGRFVTAALLDLRNPDRPVGRSVEAGKVPGRLGPLVDRLANDRLLVRSDEAGAPHLRLAHDVLATGWGRAKVWLNTYRLDIARRDSVRQHFDAWKERGKPASRLLTGAALEDCVNLRRHQPELLEHGMPDGVAEFVRASRRAALDVRIAARRQKREDRIARSLRLCEEAELELGRGDARAALHLLGFVARLNLDPRVLERLRPLLLRALLEPLRLAPCTDAGRRPKPDASNLPGRDDAATPPAAEGDLNTEVEKDPGFDPVWALAVSPSGEWLLNGTGDGRVQVRALKPEDGLPVVHEFPAHGDGDVVCTVAFAREGKAFATSGRNEERRGTVAVWQFNSQRDAELRWRSEQIDSLSARIDISDDGQTVAWGDGKTPVLGGPGWPQPARLPELEERIIALRFIPGRDDLLLGVGVEGHCALWDLGEQTMVWTDRFDNEDLLIPDANEGGFVLASAGRSAAVYAIDQKSSRVLGGKNKPQLRRRLEKHTAGVVEARYSTDNSFIGTAGSDGLVGIWTPEHHKPLHFARVDDACASVAFTPDGRYVLAGTNATGCIETLRLPLAHRRRDVPGGAPVLTADVSVDGRMVACGTDDGRTLLWRDCTDGRLELPHAGAPIVSCRLNQSGEHLAAADDKGNVRIFDIAGKPRHVTTLEAGISVPDMLWWQDEGLFLIGTLDSAVIALDTSTWQVRSGGTACPAAHDGGGIVQMSLDRRTGRLAAACWEHGVVLWPDARKLGDEPEHVLHRPASAVALQPGTNRVLAGGLDGSLRWVNTGAPQHLRWRAAHNRMVQSLEFSADGAFILSAASGFAARLWDAGTGRRVAKLQAHVDWLTAARLQADGMGAVTSSWDGTVRTWSLPLGSDSLETMRARLRELHVQPIASERAETDGETGIPWEAEEDDG